MTDTGWEAILTSTNRHKSCCNYCVVGTLRHHYGYHQSPYAVLVEVFVILHREIVSLFHTNHH